MRYGGRKSTELERLFLSVVHGKQPRRALLDKQTTIDRCRPDVLPIGISESFLNFR